MTEPYSLTNQSKNQSIKNRGIIFGVDPNISAEEMSTVLGLKAERIAKKRGGEIFQTAQMILHFENDIPSEIFYGYIRFKVSRYIPEPIRCYKCQHFGHKATSCRSKQRCSVCSGEHGVSDCPEINKEEEQKERKCANCKGNHPASYKNCPEYKKATVITKMQFQAPNRISYAEAVKIHRQDEAKKANLVPSAESIINNSTNEPAKPHRQDETTNANLAPSVEYMRTSKTLMKNSDYNTNTPPAEYKEKTSIEQNIHNDCITKTNFLIFLNKCEEISRKNENTEDKLAGLFDLIKELASQMTQKTQTQIKENQEPYPWSKNHKTQSNHEPNEDNENPESSKQKPNVTQDPTKNGK